MKSAKCLIEVTAGLLPPAIQFGGVVGENDLPEPTGWQRPRPDPEFTKQWAITSEEWEQAGLTGRMALLAERIGQAQGYAALLMTSPDRLNWVRTDWIWL